MTLSRKNFTELFQVKICFAKLWPVCFMLIWIAMNSCEFFIFGCRSRVPHGRNVDLPTRLRLEWKSNCSKLLLIRYDLFISRNCKKINSIYLWLIQSLVTYKFRLSILRIRVIFIDCAMMKIFEKSNFSTNRMHDFRILTRKSFRWREFRMRRRRTRCQIQFSSMFGALFVKTFAWSY